MSATFKDLALKYVLEDDENKLREIASQAAREIERQRGSSVSLGQWSASIKDWMSTGANDDLVEDGEETTDSGNVVARAKALGFLAATLQSLDKSIIRADKIEFLVGFFGSMFKIEHKAGITASAIALRQLVTAKNFKSEFGVKLMKDICLIKEDFRLQIAATRLEIYELILSLVQSPTVAADLRVEFGVSSGFIIDLLQMCSAERDPKNLLVWFKIIGIFLTGFSGSEDVTAEIFKTFSNYFPISMRSSGTSVGVTADGLKVALRACFSADGRLAPLAFPYLVQRIDQGDAITAAVKVDILKTMQACIERYDNPQKNLVPYVDKIWGSLKYEVRNGEVKETIDATLDVLRAIGAKLNGTSDDGTDVAVMKTYIDLVLGDSLDDLSNPTYTKQAGLLCTTVVGSSTRAFLLEGSRLAKAITDNLRQPKSPAHLKDLVALLNALLNERINLTGSRGTSMKDVDASQDAVVFHSLFEQVYLRLWREANADPSGDQAAILREVIKGITLLGGQSVYRSDGTGCTLYSDQEDSEMVLLLSHRLVAHLSLSSNDAPQAADIDSDLVASLRTMNIQNTNALALLLGIVKSTIVSKDWREPSERSLAALKDLVTRVAYIACSKLRFPIPQTSAPDALKTNQLDSYILVTGVLVEILDLMLSTKASPDALTLIMCGIHAAILNFRDACAPLPTHATLRPNLNSNHLESVLAGTSTTAAADPGPWVNLFKPLTVRQGDVIQGDPDVFGDFTQFSLFMVQALYDRVTKVDHGEEHLVWVLSPALAALQDRGLSVNAFLTQLAQIESLIIRPLDANTQSALDLGMGAFDMLGNINEHKAFWHQSHGGVLNIVALGVLESLWPAAMTDFYAPGTGPAAEIFRFNPFVGTKRAVGTHVPTAILVLLANKYTGGPKTRDPDSTVFRDVLDYHRSNIEQYMHNKALFEQFLSAAMPIFAGAVARQEKGLLSIFPTLHKAIGLESLHDGLRTARALELLVVDKPYLRTETHAIIRPLHKQWLYANFVKPMFALALPVSQNPQAQNYTVAILSILKHCSFAVYDSDVQEVIRMLMSSLPQMLASHASDAHAALKVLLQILQNDQQALKDHLTAVVDNVIKSVGRTAPGGCRKIGVQILAELSSKFEERYLLRYSPRINRLLTESCGDPVRDVRRAAIAARESWAKIV